MMETSEKYKIPEKVRRALNLAKDLHSHLGPFLVIGMRMGWAALRELEVTRGDADLKVDVHLPYVTPISCIIDGIQITTACTVGNKRLGIKNSKSIYMKFKIKSGCLTVKLRTQALTFIQKSLAKNLSVREMEKLAYRVVTMPEKQLIDITNSQK
jgi:formylmethanofuran dehydrogenase subunit E